ncbi:MAG: hypothetical protein OEY30_01310 [Candidatus Bathyarchaeota archaeon]|nr:hypothetical protein [Candidatus Bathyarchaeota archaeon]
MPKTHVELAAEQLHSLIITNEELKKLEVDEFVKGKMGATLREIVGDLCQQFINVHEAYACFLKAQKLTKLSKSIETRKARQQLKHALAQVRNIAGCCFLKLNEQDGVKS